MLSFKLRACFDIFTSSINMNFYKTGGFTNNIIFNERYNINLQFITWIDMQFDESTNINEKKAGFQINNSFNYN